MENIVLNKYIIDSICDSVFSLNTPHELIFLVITGQVRFGLATQRVVYKAVKSTKISWVTNKIEISNKFMTEIVHL